MSTLGALALHNSISFGFVQEKCSNPHLHNLYLVSFFYKLNWNYSLNPFTNLKIKKFI